VGDHLRSRDELKMEWEKFKAAAEKEKEVGYATPGDRSSFLECWHAVRGSG